MQQRVLTYSINMNGRMYDPSGENGNKNPSLKNIVFRLFFV